MQILKKSENTFLLLKQIFIVVLINLATCISGYSLAPDEILVVINSNVPGSVELAKYYSEKRNIPHDNILTLRVTDSEKCDRQQYEEDIAEPVRKFIKSNNRITCIVTMFGMPLKVASPGITWSDLITFDFSNEKSASLDSELALVLQQDYSLSMWISNPFFAGFRENELEFKKSDVIMVCRLDAPTVADVKRIIDDSLYAEKNGLTGKAYFDARWPDPGVNGLKAYAYYDRSIHLAADRINKSSLMPVIKNHGSELFQPGQCPDAALYCGWYKLSEYVDAFTWQKGSIGYHIASAECTTLKEKNSRVWCKMMLEKGIAATIGPVGEPYVQAFPIPEIFFGLLVKGEMTLVECYFESLPFVSWQMVLIGDPLYNPFKKKK